MATFIGTGSGGSVYPGCVSSTVDADPAGSRPGIASDTILGNSGSEHIEGGGGDDFICSGAADGGTGNDCLDGLANAGPV